MSYIPYDCKLLYKTTDWSVPKDVINQLNLHYKAWSKAGIGAGYGVESVKSYLSGLSWIDNWIKTYFFNKVSDYILVILFISFNFVICI